MARKGRRKTKPDHHELASWLSHAATFGVKEAARKFGCSERTIERWRARIANGELPEVAALVAEQKRQAQERCNDLLTETYEASLRRMQEVLPNASPRDVIEAVKTLGELRITRGVLGADDEQPGSGSQGSAPEGSAGQGARPAGQRLLSAVAS
jgi:transposase-like protein